MKAAVYKKYGSPDLVKIQDIQKPEPKENEILIKIVNTTVTTADSRLRALRVPFGFSMITRLVIGIKGPRKPVLGIEFAGLVESVGKNVKQFKEGDKVFGSSDLRLACHAEYTSIDESGPVSLIPDNLSFEEACAVPFGALTSLVYLRNLGKIHRGSKVLINGASGCLGTYAVQLAKYFSAEVTAVASTKNLELLKSLGADKVIDYTRDSLDKEGGDYDIIYDTVGKIYFSETKHLLKKDGLFLAAVAGLPQYLMMLWTLLFSSKRIIGTSASFKKVDLEFVKELIEAGKIKVVVDRVYPFDQIAEAHTYVDEGHKKGNVVIKL